jgi:hypothetical protein
VWVNLLQKGLLDQPQFYLCNDNVKGLSMCDIELEWKISVFYEMVWYEIEMRMNFWALKIYVFGQKDLLKILIKIGTNFDHFEWTVVDKMKLRGI